MLDKDLYDSWKNSMELYMKNRDNRRMILESVEHSPLIWPMIEENGVTRTEKYAELVAKDLWERIQLLMQVKLEQFQVNTKFLNSPPPKWSKFVTDVKLVKDLHTTTIDQFSPSLSPQYGSIHPAQHYPSTHPSIPLAISYPSTPYSNDYTSTVHQDSYPQPQSVPQIEYIISTVNQQTHLAEFPQIDSSLAVPVFKQGDDPIDAINKMMSFLSTIVTSRFPSTNNQLRNSSNPRQQVTIHDGMVTVQPVQGRQTSFAADLGIVEDPVTQTVITHNAAYQADDLDAYDSDYDDFSTATTILMANFSSYRSDVLSEEKNAQFADFEKEINYLKQTLFEQSKENELLTKTFNVFKTESKEKEAKNIDKEISLKEKVKELDNIKAQQIIPMLYDGSVISKETNAISIADFEEFDA
ncbi:hypothetical protein Tco_0649805 [Tanacetum coccineum]